MTTKTAPGLFSGPNFAEMYEGLVGRIFDPWVGPLLDDVQLGPRDRVLDVACGTGIVSRRAKERLGEAGVVVGVDLNPQMLEVARRIAPTVDWREGDAGALPLREGEQFDVVLCQQGFQFFPDRVAAAREMHRALVEGGRLGVSVWLPDEESTVLHALRRVAERHLGPIQDRRHSLGNPEPLLDALEQVGFQDIRSKRATRTIHFEDGPMFVRMNAMPLVGMSASGKELGPEDRQRVAAEIARDSAEILEQNTDREGFAYELGTTVVLARR